jgi:hypothetical protein
MGKGGGGGQTQSTVTNTNVPEYAKGYVENMLGATQRQLFSGTPGEKGEFNITGFKPYQAYGGTYDQSGNMTSYDPSKAIAGFTPMQQMAQNGIYNMQMPGEFNSASAYTADAMQRAANAGYNPGQFTMGQAQAPDVNYYQMNQPQNVQGQISQGVNLGSAPTAQAATGTADQLRAAAEMKAAQLGSSPEAQAAYMEAAQLGTSPEMAAAQAQRIQLAQAAQMQGEQAGITQLGQTPTYTGQQLNYTPQNLSYQTANAERVNALPLRDLQMQAAGNVGTQSFTQPGSAQSYMSPYMQNVVDVQQREAQRQADIAGTKRGAQFAQAGAFGGSRQAIENAEAARNLATQKGDIQAQGLQSAFQAAQGQFNTEQQARLQAELANQQVQQQTGVQNLSALLQTQGLGAQTGLTAQQLNQQSGLQAALANQQAGMQAGQFNQQQAYNTALQNAQLAQQQQLSNQGLQGQYGLQQGQMNQAVALQNAAQRQAASAANQGALNQFGLQQGQMDQATALQNAQLQQQAAANNQQYAAQYGIQNAQLQQAANAANQQSANQIGLANQQMAGQYGLAQGQMGQAANAANQAALNQFSLQQGTMNQQMAMGNVANRQQTALANQALRGQYGLTQGQLGQANNQFNAQQRQAANLANQQMAYNTGMQNLQANLGVQQLGSGQNMQAQLANQQAMLANQQAIEQSRQFGANYGQQMNAQQLAAAQQLGGLGQQRLTAQQGIYGLQNQVGGQQQQQQQQIINQSLQDYSNAQQYPMLQLGTMSNMLRGLPMQASTTNMYQAAPNAITQGIGAVGAYGALSNAFGSPSGGTRPYKQGGAIRGGIMSYDVGGEIESTLSKMDVDDLKRYAKESSSPSIKQMAARLIQEKSMPVPRMARGGILAFAKSTEENNQSLVEGEDAEKLRKYGGAPSYLYNPGEFLSKINPLRMLGDRHAEAFGTKLSAPPPAAAPAEPAPPPAALTNPSAITTVPTAGPAPSPRPSAGIAQAAAAAPVAAPRPPAPRPSAGPAPAPAPTPAPAPAPAGVAGAPPFPSQRAVPDSPEETAYRAQADVVNKETNKPLSSYVEDVKAAYKAAGVDPENTGMKDYRSKIMAERANIDDEAKRQKNLRLAEFFASWGSTPGATLVAGMTALKKTIPTLIEDEKERKKAIREADKIIYELEQADRLEKKGYVSEASARKEKIADRAEKYNDGLARIGQSKRTAQITQQGNEAAYQSQTYGSETSANTSRYVADSSAAYHRYSADAGVRAAQIREQSAHADRVANRQTADENKRFGQYQAAAEQERRALSRIATEENGDQYKADVRLLESGASSTNPTMIEMRKQAEKRVNARKEEWNTIRENAKRDTELAYSRLTIQGDTAPPRGGATAPPPGHTLAGYTPDGKPVYKNAQGKTFVGQ